MHEAARLAFGVCLLLIFAGATLLSVGAWLVLLDLARRGASAAEDAQAKGASIGQWWNGERWIDK